MEKFLLGNGSANTDVEISPYDPVLEGWITWTTPNISGITSLDETDQADKQYDLLQNYPNAFQEHTEINYSLKKDSDVLICLYDITGKKITTLLNEKQTAGEQTLTFNGSELVNGFYFYTLEIDEFITSRKMLLLR